MLPQGQLFPVTGSWIRQEPVKDYDPNLWKKNTHADMSGIKSNAISEFFNRLLLIVIPEPDFTRSRTTGSGCREL
jgi:hypothetical protein